MSVLWSLWILVWMSACTPSASQTHSEWNRYGCEELRVALRRPKFEGRANNVVLFIGDGMDLVSVTLAGHLKSQLLKSPGGKQSKLSFEHFPNIGLSRTYSADRLIPDSASTGTALLTGCKTNYRVLGLDSGVPFGDCSSLRPRNRLDTFLLQARRQGRSVGIVTTTRLTHATPASCYAQTPSRYWENDSIRDRYVTKTLRSRCPDIATQMVTRGIDINVLLGGGRREFLLSSTTNGQGKRKDKDLIKLWIQQQKQRHRRYRYIENRKELRNLDLSQVDYLLGAFSWSHMDFEMDRLKRGEQPSLSEMTKAAIKILSRNPKGFVLMVEGGRIDHAHHRNMAQYAITDVLAFDNAITTATNILPENDTLIVVTADHGHNVNFGGYLPRGMDIFGLVDTTGDGPDLAKDGKAFSSILYGNGPSARVNKPRPDISFDDVKHRDYKYPSVVPRKSESHGGQNVGIFARGVMAHLVHSVHEQNYIAHLIKYAACLAPYSMRPGC